MNTRTSCSTPVGLVLSLFLLAIWALAGSPGPVNGQGSAPITTFTLSAPAVFDGDVRNLPSVAATPDERPLLTTDVARPTGTRLDGAPAPAESPAVPNAMPSPSASFEGLAKNDSCAGGSCGGGWPPDTNGDVGPNHYVQAVNTAVGIFNKSGTRLAGFTFNSLWSGAFTGTNCDSQNRGDPVVVYDPQGDRWIVSDFAFASSTATPFYECIAVSRGADPVSGGWYLYALRADDASHPWLNDYPKLGVWRDGLYMSANMFNSSLSFAGVRVWALNLAQMEAGAAVTVLVADLSTSYFALLPSNMRGMPPPAGTPAYFVSQSWLSTAFSVWKFAVNWATPGASTFTGPTNVSQTAYTTFSNRIIPQPDTASRLDSIGDRLMMQAQYRNIGGVESLWVAHTVRSSSTSTTRLQWAQINVTGGTIATTPVQQQIYSNGGDALYRWIPSLAVDGNGNMAIGFSTSYTSSYPSLAYAGRLAADPLGTLGQGEATLFAGSASQITACGSFPACPRWGDYSAMTIDPTDNCTFWYTNEYFASGDTVNWRTRIGSFKFAACVPSHVTNQYLPVIMR
ncbi:MAG: hypothetical protein HZB53_03285 [Chloroflexi bacterium]|nr:hypothetical protein [Chloroflexota bacterium]